MEGTEAEKLQAFAEAARFLKNRIAAFVNLPLSSLDKLALQAKLKEIGTLEGATSGNGKG